MIKPIIMIMVGRGHFTAIPDMPLPVDIENKTGYNLEVEVLCWSQGRVSIIIRELPDGQQPDNRHSGA